MKGNPEVLDFDDVKWTARIQAPGHTGVDYVRFVNPQGSLRGTGIPAGSWSRVTEDELHRLFLNTIPLPGRHRS